MRKIKYIVIHCTATHQTATVEGIKKYWTDRLGWKNPGYHCIIDIEGNIIQLLPFSGIANGVRGYNKESIHISWIGGYNGVDNRTEKQKEALKALVKRLKDILPDATVLGHRDFPNVIKSCPNFNAKKLDRY